MSGFAVETRALTKAEIHELHLTPAEIAEYNKLLAGGNAAKMAAFYQQILKAAGHSHHMENWEKSLLEWSDRFAVQIVHTASYMNEMTKMINLATEAMGLIENFLNGVANHDSAEQLTNAMIKMGYIGKGEIAPTTPGGKPTKLDLSPTHLAQLKAMVTSFSSYLNALADELSDTVFKAGPKVIGTCGYGAGIIAGLANMLTGPSGYSPAQIAQFNQTLVGNAQGIKENGYTASNTYMTDIGNFQGQWNGGVSIASGLNSNTMIQLTDYQKKLANLQQTASAVAKMQNQLLMSIINRSSTT